MSPSDRLLVLSQLVDELPAGEQAELVRVFAAACFAVVRHLQGRATETEARFAVTRAGAELRRAAGKASEATSVPLGSPLEFQATPGFFGDEPRSDEADNGEVEQLRRLTAVAVIREERAAWWTQFGGGMVPFDGPWLSALGAGKTGAEAAQLGADALLDAFVARLVTRFAARPETLAETEAQDLRAAARALIDVLPRPWTALEACRELGAMLGMTESDLARPPPLSALLTAAQEAWTAEPKGTRVLLDRLQRAYDAVPRDVDEKLAGLDTKERG